MALRALLAVLGLVAAPCAALSGANVMRDPVTGNWVEATGDMPDPRVGGGGGGFFGDIFGGPADGVHPDSDGLASKPSAGLPRVKGLPSLADMAKKVAAQRGASVTSSVVSNSHPSRLPGVSTTTRKAKTKKFTKEIRVADIPGYEAPETPDILAAPSRPAARTHERPSPRELRVAQVNDVAPARPAPAAAQRMLDDMQAQIQTAAAANLEATEGEGALNWRPPNQVESVVHPYHQTNAVQIAGALPTTIIGDLCRYTGYAPLEDCPAEAPNGCVDREGCSRTCVVDGYFNWRCVGPNELAADAVDNPADTPEEETPTDNTAAVNAMAAKLEAAMGNQDYQQMARLILESTPTVAAKGSNARRAQLAKAVSSLSQHAQHKVAPKPAPKPAAAAPSRQTPQQQLSSAPPKLAPALAANPPAALAPAPAPVTPVLAQHEAVARHLAAMPAFPAAPPRPEKQAYMSDSMKKALAKANKKIRTHA